jgi:hypothetical protein
MLGSSFSLSFLFSVCYRSVSEIPLLHAWRVELGWGSACLMRFSSFYTCMIYNRQNTITGGLNAHLWTVVHDRFLISAILYYGSVWRNNLQMLNSK